MKRFPSVIRRRSKGKVRGITGADKLVGEFYIVGDNPESLDVYWHRKPLRHLYKYNIIPACFLLCEGVSEARASLRISQFLEGDI